MATKLEFDVQLSDQLSVEGTSSLKAGLPVQLRPSQDGGPVEVVWQDMTLGIAPAQHHAMLIRSHTQQGTIRSIKRSPEGGIASILVRVQLGQAAPPRPPEPVQQATAQEEDLVSQHALKLEQLQHLAQSPELQLMLKDERLQELMLKIDGAPNREVALDKALQQADFQQVADKMLELINTSK